MSLAGPPGAAQIFGNVMELRPTLGQMLGPGADRPAQLQLIVGEAHPTTRAAGDSTASSLAGHPVARVTIGSLEHLGGVVDQVMAAQQMEAVAAQMAAASAAMASAMSVEPPAAPEGSSTTDANAAGDSGSSSAPTAGEPPVPPAAVAAAAAVPVQPPAALAASRRRVLLGEGEEGSGMVDVVEGPARVDYDSEPEDEGEPEGTVAPEV